MPSDEDEIEEAFDENTEFWTELLNGMDVYQEYLDLTRKDKAISNLRDQNLLMKPVTHMALAHSLISQRSTVLRGEMSLRN